jgi:prephenate dehydrogenase
MFNIAILGLGLIGGSIAKALKQSSLKVKIGAFDKTEILEIAKSENSIDEILNSIDEALNYSIIFVCLPVDLSIDVIKQLGPHLKKGTIISDVCSIKGKLTDIWNETKSAGSYIGGHPMTGKEQGGYKNSDSLLFENSTYIINDDVKEQSFAVPFFELIKSMGAKIYFVDANLHDQIVANVSHLPQLLSVALVNNSSININGIKFTDFAAGGFRNMTRIASSDYKLWESIVSNNRDQILKVIDNFTYRLSEISKLVKRGDNEALSKEFESARYLRDEIPKDTKGFLSPLIDLFVFVKDQPGIISKISTALFEQNINIKDIELLKIREGTGGTFRLSFEDENDVNKAKIILEEIGFQTKV